LVSLGGESWKKAKHTLYIRYIASKIHAVYEIIVKNIARPFRVIDNLRYHGEKKRRLRLRLR
jgi:hypothetical protein